MPIMRAFNLTRRPRRIQQERNDDERRRLLDTDEDTALDYASDNSLTGTNDDPNQVISLLEALNMPESTAPPPSSSTWSPATTSYTVPAGLVDLTNEPPVPKRRRLDTDKALPAAPGTSSRNRDNDIEEIDLRDVEDDTGLAKVLAQQQSSTIAAQQGATNGSPTLSTIQCAVCMDVVTDITATHCGHVFCNVCINRALIAGEQSGPDPGKGPSKCPNCRKKIARKDARQLIPLEIKLRPKGSTDGKGKGRASDPTEL